MPLTPAIHDPNRTAELERKRKDPASFGVSGKDGGRDRKTATQQQLEAEMQGVERAQALIDEENAKLDARQVAIDNQQKQLDEQMAAFNEMQHKQGQTGGSRKKA